MLQLKFKPLIIITLAYGLSSCGSGGGSDSTFSEVPDISVTCEAADGGPAVCNDGINNKPVKLAWASGSCSDTSLNNMVAYEDTTLSCVANVCRAHDHVSWLSPTTKTQIYSIPSGNTKALAWINAVNNGSNDSLGPQSGDIFCCRIETNPAADIATSECVTVP